MIALVLVALLAQGPRDVARDLGSDDYAKREAASRELEEMGTIAIPALEEAEKSDDPEVRERASELIEGIRQIAAYGGRIVPEEMEEIAESLFANVIPRDGRVEPYEPQPADLPCLLALIAHPSLPAEWKPVAPDARAVRLHALEAISHFRLSEANESRLARLLEEVLPSPMTPTAHEEASEFLALVEASHVLEHPGLRAALRRRLLAGLEEISRSTEAGLRLEVAGDLYAWGDDGATGILARLLDDGDPNVAHRALASLWAYDVAGLEPALRRHLRATLDESDRLLAAHLLARSGDFGGLAVLFRALAGEDLPLRNDACRRLSAILRRPLASDDASRADAEALLSWWAENGEIVHWDPTLARFVAR